MKKNIENNKSLLFLVRIYFIVLRVNKLLYNRYFKIMSKEPFKFEAPKLEVMVS